jgi:hypothetical protein
MAIIQRRQRPDTNGNDLLCGLGGNDTLRGLGGNDVPFMVMLRGHVTLAVTDFDM